MENGMERDSMVFYRSFFEAIKDLDAEDFKACVEAIMEYGLEGEEPEVNGIAKTVFTLVKPQIAKNNQRYANGVKGGKPTSNQTVTKTEPNANQTETKAEPKVEKAEPNVNVNVNDNVNDIKKEKVKKEKHCHGEYKHVRLTDAEYERLGKDFGETKRAALIKRFDEYLQEKPSYKSNDHNLAIRRWVVKAVEEDTQKGTGKVPNTTFHNFDNKHNYDFDEMEKVLLG